MNTAGAQNVTILSAAPFAHALQQAVWFTGKININSKKTPKKLNIQET